MYNSTPSSDDKKFINELSPGWSLSPIKSPVKNNVNNGLNSDDIFNKDIEFMSQFFKKKDNQNNLTNPMYIKIIKSKLNENKIKDKNPKINNTNIKANKIKMITGSTNMKTKIIINEIFKCKLCNNNSHYTDDCFFKCNRLSCKNLQHKKQKCPYNHK